MRFGKFRFEAQRLADVLDRQVTAAPLVGEQAQQMHCPDMLGIHPQDLTVELFRLRQPPRLMVLHGHVKA